MTAEANSPALSGKTNTDQLISLFNLVIIDHPLRGREDFARTQEATSILEGLLRDKPEVLPISAIKSILDGLSVLDVPTDVSSANLETNERKSDFAFLDTGKEHMVAFATLASKTKSLICYQLDLQKPLNWKQAGKQSDISKK